jgi:hypothetical protein
VLVVIEPASVGSQGVVKDTDAGDALAFQGGHVTLAKELAVVGTQLGVSSLRP